MPLSSYYVLSGNKYIGDPIGRDIPASARVIPIEEHRSMQFEPLTVSSWPREADMLQRPHLIKSKGNVYAVSRTANNRYVAPLEDYLAHGHFSEIDGFNPFNPNSFERWKQAGEEVMPAMFDVVPLPERTSKSGVIESFGERYANFAIGDTHVKKFVHDFYVQNVPNNEVGKFVSRIENLKGDQRKWYRTREGQELLSRSPDEIGWAASGFLPKEALYGVGRARDGRIMIAAAEDVYDRIMEQAEIFGVSPEDLRNSALTEEEIHILRGSFDKSNWGILVVLEEMATKAAARDLYLRLAEGAEGNPELQRKYRRLAAIKEFDRRTTPQRYSKISAYNQLYLKERAALEALLVQEAIQEGYGVKDIKAYVASRLIKIGGEARNGEEVEGSKMSKLERIAEKGANEADVKEAKEAPETSEQSEASE